MTLDDITFTQKHVFKNLWDGRTDMIAVRNLSVLNLTKLCARFIKSCVSVCQSRCY